MAAPDCPSHCLPPRLAPARFTARRGLPVTMVSALSLLVGGGVSSEMSEHVLGAAAAATVGSSMIMVSAYVPLACTVSTGPLNAPAPSVGPDPNAPTENVTISVSSAVASNCSDGSTPSVNVEQSSRIISASGLANTASATSSDERDGRRFLTSDLALDAGRSPLRVVTVIY